LKVLIIDFNESFRKTLQTILSAHFRSIQFENAGERDSAIKIIKHFQPDAVIMDIRFPGEKPFDLVKTIKDESKDVIIIVMTYNDSPEYRQTAIKIGADYFLSKRISSTEDIFNVVKQIKGRVQNNNLS
jgi:two-component system response regulator YesN